MSFSDIRRFSVVAATAHQATLILEVQRRTWLATYPNPGDPNPVHRVTRADIEHHFKNRAAPEMMRKFAHQLMAPPNNSIFLVSKEYDVVTGIVHGLVHSTHNEIKILYVIPSRQRMGTGMNLLYQLFKHTLPNIAHFNDRLPTSAEVVEYNQAGVNFYKKMGFREVRRYEDEHFKFESGAHFPLIEMVMPPRSVSS
jgi:GNAT superfamily N-acetyltransferase